MAPSRARVSPQGLARPPMGRCPQTVGLRRSGDTIRDSTRPSIVPPSRVGRWGAGPLSQVRADVRVGPATVVAERPLTRISHQPSAAGAYLTPSQGLLLHGVLDVLTSTSASPAPHEAPLLYSAILPLRGKTLRSDATYTLSRRSLARKCGLSDSSAGGDRGTCYATRAKAAHGTMLSEAKPP